MLSRLKRWLDKRTVVKVYGDPQMGFCLTAPGMVLAVCVEFRGECRHPPNNVIIGQGVNVYQEAMGRDNDLWLYPDQLSHMVACYVYVHEGWMELVSPKEFENGRLKEMKPTERVVM